jgi:hypothetical protein
MVRENTIPKICGENPVCYSFGETVSLQTPGVRLPNQNPWERTTDTTLLKKLKLKILLLYSVVQIARNLVLSIA